VTCRQVENAIICDGVSGWRVEPAKRCPWCLETRRCLGTPIFSGYGGHDYICGTCGSYWSEDDYVSYRKLTNDQRDANIARVAGRADPKCWDCHDTGDAGTFLDEPDSHPCKCGAGDRAEGQEGK
jgi:hypothetical protein